MVNPIHYPIGYSTRLGRFEDTRGDSYNGCESRARFLQAEFIANATHPPMGCQPTSIACLRKNILVSTTEIILELHSSKENDYHFPALSASWCRSTERNCSIGTMLHMTHCKDQATENLG
jgi:hypothetical protein